nr:hypothetical protein [Tanacetum cinerariifolium]
HGQSALLYYSCGTSGYTGHCDENGICLHAPVNVIRKSADVLVDFLSLINNKLGIDQVLEAWPACHPSLVSCLPLLRESLPYLPNAYAVFGVSGAETRVHTPALSESEAQNGLPDSILSIEPKPLV